MFSTLNKIHVATFVLAALTTLLMSSAARADSAILVYGSPENCPVGAICTVPKVKLYGMGGHDFGTTTAATVAPGEDDGGGHGRGHGYGDGGPHGYGDGNGFGGRGGGGSGGGHEGGGGGGKGGGGHEGGGGGGKGGGGGGCGDGEHEK
jgi:hypothetical protein